MRQRVCTNCEKSFRQNESPDITHWALIVGRDSEEPLCYHCALLKVTGGYAPEAGDFNTARLISGELTDADWEFMRASFRAVETGRSAPEPYDDPHCDDDWDDDWEDDCEDVWGLEYHPDDDPLVERYSDLDPME